MVIPAPSERVTLAAFFLATENPLRKKSRRLAIDLGKHSIYFHEQDRHGKADFRRKIGRKQPVALFVIRDYTFGRMLLGVRKMR
jgi:hypothetical protein